MKKRPHRVTSLFLILFVLTILILIGIKQNIIFPFSPLIAIQKNFFIFTSNYFISTQDKEREKLKEEVFSLRNELIKEKNRYISSKLSRDEEQTSPLEFNKLIQANIIGMPTFIPNISYPKTFTLDRGTKDGIRVGQIVVYKNNLVGRIGRVNHFSSVVNLSDSEDISLAGKTLKTQALGVIKGKKEGIIVFQNVLLSDKLQKEDIVLSLGNQSISGGGYPQNLVVGRITRIEKKSSDLFQTAYVQSFLDMAHLRVVFVLTQ